MRLRRCAPAFAIVLLCVLPLQASSQSITTNTWQQGAVLSTARTDATATLMADGRILIVGGTDGSGNALETAEVLNPDGTIAPVPSMLAQRYGHSAILLHDGNVLVAGGHTSGGGVVNSAELFDPVANTWRWAANTMADPRADFTLSQLIDGNILVAGGDNGSGPISGVEKFDLLTKAFKYIGSLNTARKAHAASVLKDDRVLITGGSAVAQDGSTIALTSTEIYDPNSTGLSAGPPLNVGRFAHSATTLIDGTVLLAGGNSGSADLTSIEIFDPGANTLTLSSAHLATARSGHIALLLPNNNGVLLAGGTSFSTALSSSELYQSWNSTILTNARMNAARQGAAASAVQADGVALVAGGSNLASTELYGFPTVKTDASDYPPGSPVHITGSGWVPGETVALTLIESPLIDTHGPYVAVADANGNISDNSFATDAHDLNVGFALTAVGSKSQAFNMFTDSNPQTLTVGSQSPNPVIVGSSASYGINLTFNGNNTACTFDFSISGLPAGASGGFNPSSRSSTGSTVTSTLTITTTASLSPSSSPYSFTVSITNTSTGCQGSKPSATASLVVQGKTGTTTTITNTGALATATVVGQAYPVTYSVMAGTGTPTGTVMVSDGLVSCTASVTAGTCNLASTSSGTKNITATYSGDANFATSTSSGASHVVNAASTSTALTSSVNPSVSGQSVTFTATVTVSFPGAGSVPLGSVVTFKDGSAVLGTGITDSAGVATYSTTALTDGNRSITAVYSGNTNFTTSTSSAVAQLVKGNSTFSSLVPLSASITYGQVSISISGQVANATKTVFAASGETVTVTINGTPMPMTIQGSSGNFSGTFDTHAISASGSPYTISYSYSGDANLTAGTDTSTKLTVSKATLTVTANDLSTVYGAAVPAYTSAITGFVNGEPQSVVTGSASLSSSPASPTNAGTYTITAATGTLASVNYSFSFVNGTLTINRAVASVTPNAASKTYGTADPALTGTLTGFLAADGVTAAYSRAAGETVAGGPYSITAVLSPTAVLSNYTITYNMAAFTINKAVASVTPNAASKTYGTADPALTGTLTGFLAADGVTAVYSRAAGEIVAGGPYSISAVLSPAAVLDNYTITYNTAAFTINKAVASVTPNAASKTYGTADPVLTGALTGFLVSDGVTATYSRAAGETVAGGPYSISAVLSPVAVLSNYTITYNTAAFTINQRTLTVTATAASRTYDGTTSASVTLSDNRVAGDLLTETSTSATFSDRNAGSGKTVTVTGISISGADVGNYILGNTTVSTTADITARAIEVTGTSDSKPYDATTTSSKSPSITVGSLVAGDSATYTQVFDSKNAGTRSLLPSIVITDGNNGHNYSVIFHNANGTISPLTIAGSIIVLDKTYDGTITASIATRNLSGVLANDVVSFMGGTATFSDSNAGVGKTVTAVGLYLAGTDAGNYAVSPTATTTATIFKANQQISWSTPAPIVFGTSLGNTQLDATVAGVQGGTSPGALTYSPAAGTILGVGSNQLHVDAASTNNYNAATTTVSINVFYSTGACLGDLGHTILQPINADGSSTFKQGSTVPAKFRVCDAAGHSIGTAGLVTSFNLVQTISGTASATVDDTVISTTPDSSFRWDSTAQQWIFNVSTKPLSAQTTYVYSIGLNDGSTIFFRYGLPK